jgi:hypothetical protein
LSKEVKTEEIEDGMILCHSLINKFGQILLPSGTNLNIKHIKLLKTWNIISISVKNGEEEEDLTISDEMRIIAENELSKRMKWKPRIPIEENLFEMAKLFTVKDKVKKNSLDK